MAVPVGGPPVPSLGWPLRAPSSDGQQKSILQEFPHSRQNRDMCHRKGPLLGSPQGPLCLLEVSLPDDRGDFTSHLDGPLSWDTHFKGPAASPLEKMASDKGRGPLQGARPPAGHWVGSPCTLGSWWAVSTEGSDLVPILPAPSQPRRESTGSRRVWWLLPAAPPSRKMESGVEVPPGPPPDVLPPPWAAQPPRPGGVECVGLSTPSSSRVPDETRRPTLSPHPSTCLIFAGALATRCSHLICSSGRQRVFCPPARGASAARVGGDSVRLVPGSVLLRGRRSANVSSGTGSAPPVKWVREVV
ncbi:uncharacterized protein LOC128627078 [Artibeus jamaicensis]|uniref:uncharacterized protein LOC128627078 n=1 Tax=Artibeus jamaicensis TaxID=9417 RepID=UPI00235B2B47|nr:uncharacterized protein LOC128627078 [Artibeus jamaicensis]